MDTLEPSAIAARIAELRREHRALDERIDQLAANPVDELEAKRLKRRKLQIKDCIARLESMLIPDQPA
ncbi:YdcH family protein [Pseudoxanthomonas sp. J35]|uniref:YdcH family protein n=1 Tax=Pseudoxanthomonas sp. J35 TaxID=935852 RepID=UPI00048B169E|nr:YdcH family protein [Pseudoxanthomonas sp. J35]